MIPGISPSASIAGACPSISMIWRSISFAYSSSNSASFLTFSACRRVWIPGSRLIMIPASSKQRYSASLESRSKVIFRLLYRDSSAPSSRYGTAASSNALVILIVFTPFSPIQSHTLRTTARYGDLSETCTFRTCM